MLTRTPDRLANYIQAIKRLAPVVDAHRDAFDTDRRLPDSVFVAVAEAGLFRLWLPEAQGGPQLSPTEFMQVVEEAAALDGSVGWLVGNGSGMSRVGGYLSEAVARAWFSDPLAFIASATGAVGKARRTEGGYRVTGRWPFASGAHHATVFMGLASLQGPGGQDEPPLCFYMERKYVAIHDTWRVSGLRGTGSCDFEAQDIFVPDDHTHAFVGPEPTQPGIVYRLPTFSVFPWTVSVVPLGIARSAMDSFVDLANRKTRIGTSALMRDRETVQNTVGRAKALHRSARAFLMEAMTDLMVAVAEDDARLVDARAIFRAACSHAAETAVQIVDMLSAEAGATAIFETSPMERPIRDIHAAVRHLAMSAGSFGVLGRVQLGLDPGTPRF
jgi:alkylation response protein AidB-like acyl-CoA dehydrogenase